MYQKQSLTLSIFGAKNKSSPVAYYMHAFVITITPYICAQQITHYFLAGGLSFKNSNANALCKGA